MKAWLDRLAGQWQVKRRIAPGGTFKGTAAFVPRGQRVLAYEEAGTMHVDYGPEVLAKKAYRYVLADDNRLHIYFSDGPSVGGLFQTLDPLNATTAKAYHHCAPDEYSSTYHWVSPDELVITHKVSGPHKRYTIESTYLRERSE